MDWLFKTGEGICHVRTAAVIIRDGSILLQCSGGSYALPGGHLRFGETTQDALVRELREEIGQEPQYLRLLWTEENFWRWGDSDAHNLGFYYLVQLPEDSYVPEGSAMLDNASVSFHWIPIEELDEVTVYPEFLKTEVRQLDGPIKHFVRRDDFPAI